MTTTACDCAPAAVAPLTAEPSFRDRLFEAGLLIETGVDGVYGGSSTYLSIKNALDRIIGVWGRELGATEVSFPPVMARSTFRKSGYLESFPDLMGSVHVFRGDERDHRELLRRTDEDADWPAKLEPAEVVLCSAACHVLYPMCTGTLPDGGRLYEINNVCFRHEPSDDPARMQAFQMHEVVFIGDAEAAQHHRDSGLERALSELCALGLDMDAIPANDPFFGRGGALLAADQRAEALKIEGVATVSSDSKPTAILSANCHRDHFGRDFEIRTADGEVAHSARVGFGVDRIALALLRAHGLDVDAWPAAVKQRLWS